LALQDDAFGDAHADMVFTDELAANFATKRWHEASKRAEPRLIRVGQ